MSINKTIQSEIIEATKLLDDRGEIYGDAIENHTDIKDFFNLLLKDKIKDDLSMLDVIYCVIGQKLARLMKSPKHEDSLRDIINYCGIALVTIQKDDRQLELVKNVSKFEGDYDNKQNT
tara:strand:- start:366 stop:722 length:357 start_codon:yes stop_codon:yes gene_type:complete